MSRKFDFLKTQVAEITRTQQPELSDAGDELAPVEAGLQSQAGSPRSLPYERLRRGRPAGKRTDPEYSQVTAYIRKSTHHAVKVRLLQQGEGREFSELVEELLSDWLKK